MGMSAPFAAPAITSVVTEACLINGVRVTVLLFNDSDPIDLAVSRAYAAKYCGN